MSNKKKQTITSVPRIMTKKRKTTNPEVIENT